MSLLNQIQADIKTAMKAKNETQVSTLRMFVAAVNNRQIALRKNIEDVGKELAESEIIAVLKTEIKKRQESVIEYEKGGRTELAAKEKAEAAILAAYLPPQLDEAAIRQLVKNKIIQLGATGPQDFGKVMSQTMAESQGAADGNLVSKIVKEELAPKS